MPYFTSRFHISSRMKNAVSIFAAVILSWMIGKLLAPSALKFMEQNNNASTILIGLFVFFGFFLCVRSIIIAIYNYRLEESVADDVPDTLREVSALGIQSPLDFCAAMQMIFSYREIPNLGLPSIFLKESNSSTAWNKAIELFRSLYGRDPHGADSNGDVAWGFFTMQEARAMLNKPENERVSVDEFVNLLSPELQERLCGKKKAGMKP